MKYHHLEIPTIKFRPAVLYIFAYLFAGLFAMTLNAGTLRSTADRMAFNLNGVHIELDRETGNIVNLSTEDGCTFLETVPQRASLIDLAFPVPEFEPLRRASRFSEKVRIDWQENGIRVYWENLTASRPLPLNGQVAATVRFQAAPDNHSIILTCTIENKSDQSIRQVLFPDLMGLIPFAGEKQTRFRSAAFVNDPFVILKADPEMVPFYATGPFRAGNGWVEYKSGRYKAFSQKLVDWLDLGGLTDGFSLHARRWPPEDPDISIMMHLAENDQKLRLLFSHTIDIAPGKTWQSDDYWLTPHRHGWAEGIKPFREWVSQHAIKTIELPDHVKKGMGFRSLWMGRGLPGDGERDVIYTYQDLPRIARECMDHGLNELVLWFWSNYFELPINTINTLGSPQDLIKAIADCRELGVNVSLFVSVLYLKNPTAARYGLIPAKETSWTYHPELIPIFNPPYASWNQAVMADQSDKQWQADVLASFEKFIGMGLSSFVWDVYMAAPTSPNLYDLTAKIRAAAKGKNPQSVFAGEGGCAIAEDARYLDYTWNWNWNWPHYKDFRAYTSVFENPRLNVNIDESVKVVNYCFADNAYMNIMPAPPDGINASDLIVNHPALSLALIRCAKLREQFLPYFIEGRLIGDCILVKDAPAAHISAYVLPDKILMILVKDDTEGRVSLTCDPAFWQGQGKNEGVVKIFDSNGQLRETRQRTDPLWKYTTPSLAPYDICLYEFCLKEETQE